MDLVSKFFLTRIDTLVVGKLINSMVMEHSFFFMEQCMFKFYVLFRSYKYDLINRFQGTFQNNVRYGKGSMYLPNGDCLTGEWNGSSINNTVFTKGSPKNREATILYQMDYEISNELKRQLNAGYMTKTPRMNDNNSYDSYCLLRWKQYKIIHEDIAQKEQELLAETFCKELKSIQDFKRCISILLDGTYGTVESQMYFKSLVSFFLDLFYGMFLCVTNIWNTHDCFSRFILFNSRNKELSTGNAICY